MYEGLVAYTICVILLPLVIIHSSVTAGETTVRRQLPLSCYNQSDCDTHVIILNQATNAGRISVLHHDKKLCRQILISKA